jgi:hypothetical protein
MQELHVLTAGERGSVPPMQRVDACADPTRGLHRIRDPAVAERCSRHILHGRSLWIHDDLCQVPARWWRHRPR